MDIITLSRHAAPLHVHGTPLTVTRSLMFDPPPPLHKNRLGTHSVLFRGRWGVVTVAWFNVFIVNVLRRGGRNPWLKFDLQSTSSSSTTGWRALSTSSVVSWASSQ
jgi:hypothetical protein